MTISTGVFILALLGLSVVAFFGGRVSISGLTINTGGLQAYLLKAQKARAMQASLPLKDVAAEVRRKTRSLPHVLPLAKILWVDDSPLNNQAERLAFANVGIFTDSYTNNTDALSALRLEQYDVVISDIGRGESTETGWDLAGAVRSANPSIPFFLYTYGSSESDKVRARQLGLNGVIELPSALMVDVVNSIRETNR